MKKYYTRKANGNINSRFTIGYLPLHGRHNSHMPRVFTDVRLATQPLERMANGPGTRLEGLAGSQD